MKKNSLYFYILGASALFTTIVALLPSPMGVASPAAGVCAGLSIVACAFVLFKVFAVKEHPGTFASLLQSHLIGTLVRIPTLVIIFCVIIFLLKMHIIGILIGVSIAGLAGAALGFVKFATGTRIPATESNG